MIQHAGTGRISCRKEIAVAHHQHLQREEQHGKGIYIQQGIGIAHLQQVGQLHNLHQVQHSYRPLGRKQLVEMRVVGFGAIVPLKNPSVQVGEDKRQVDCKQ